MHKTKKYMFRHFRAISDIQQHNTIVFQVNCVSRGKNNYYQIYAYNNYILGFYFILIAIALQNQKT